MNLCFEINGACIYSTLIVLSENSTYLAGAHSHIRGLGLDDALEAREVCIHVFYKKRVYRKLQ